MSRTVVAAIAAVCALIAVVVFLNRPEPEPTPQERLKQAAEDAASALQDAGDAVATSARKTGEALTAEVQESVAKLAEDMAAQTEKFSEEARKLTAAWQDAGIMTEDGIDYEQARTLLEQSSIAQATKDKIAEVLEQLQAAPDQIEQKLGEIQELLKQE